MISANQISYYKKYHVADSPPCGYFISQYFLHQHEKKSEFGSVMNESKCIGLVWNRFNVCRQGAIRHIKEKYDFNPPTRNS